MSRIGRLPISIPTGITVDIIDGNVKVKGPKGELEYLTRPEISVKIVGSEVICEIEKDSKEASAYWGLTRSLIANMIEGVENGFEKSLELVGVGYRATSESPNKVSITVGYSHPVVFEAPAGIELEVPDNKNIKVKGIDKQLVGLTAARIRKIRKPEPYKGKGIKYIDEVVRRKPGKTGKV